LAWRLKMDANRHKVKRQRSNKRLKSPPKKNKQNLHQHSPRGQKIALLPNSNLALEVIAKSQWRILGKLRDAAPGGVSLGSMYVCTHVRAGLYQRAVLSDSSSESLLSVTECRGACSRGLRRSVDPSSMWMEGISKWTRSASQQRGK
jgi:hypothetical protein